MRCNIGDPRRKAPFALVGFRSLPLARGVRRSAAAPLRRAGDPLSCAARAPHLGFVRCSPLCSARCPSRGPNRRAPPSPQPAPPFRQFPHPSPAAMLLTGRWLRSLGCGAPRAARNELSSRCAAEPRPAAIPEPFTALYRPLPSLAILDRCAAESLRSGVVGAAEPRSAAVERIRPSPLWRQEAREAAEGIAVSPCDRRIRQSPLWKYPLRSFGVPRDPPPRQGPVGGVPGPGPGEALRAQLCVEYSIMYYT